MKRLALPAALSVTSLLVLFLWPALALAGLGSLVPETRAAAGCPPVATTPSFTIAYGSVLLDGADALAGTVVEALDPRGNVVGCFEVNTAGSFGAMFVYGEDASANPPIPGMRDGETVVFRVSGQPATATPELQWSADMAFHWVALVATRPTSVDCYTLQLGASPPGSGSVDADEPFTCPQNGIPGQYAAGSQVQVRAAPGPGFRFSHWSGDVRGNANPITLIMDRDRHFVANFALLETDSIYLPLIRQER